MKTACDSMNSKRIMLSYLDTVPHQQFIANGRKYTSKHRRLSRLSHIFALALLVILALTLSVAVAEKPADISNTQNFLFVADKQEPIVDVIDIHELAPVHRLTLESPAGNLVATPYAPLLLYTNQLGRSVGILDLRIKKLTSSIKLQSAPTNMVLSPSGTIAAVTGIEQGGFALIDTYRQELLFELENFPPTGDVLFDLNGTDIYYVNSLNGSLGVIRINSQKYFEMPLFAGEKVNLMSPSRSLDGRYLYIADSDSGTVLGLDAFTKRVKKSFSVGERPVRPYTTPEGNFVYLMDQTSGRFTAYDQFHFEMFADVVMERGLNMMAIGRFDRMNLLLSDSHRRWQIFDNMTRKIVRHGEFSGSPIGVLGAAGGEVAYVAFSDIDQVAAVNLESGEITYVGATMNGAGVFTLGLSNNVCH